MSDERERPVKGTARMRMRVTVEVYAPGTYGPDWILADIFKQAKREALEHLTQVGQKHGFMVVGEPEVEAVFMPEKKR